MKFVVTVDWYDEDSGHNLEVLCVTDNEDTAKQAFRDYVESHRQLDVDDGYTIMDDGDYVYYAHGTMPTYHRVQINNYGG